MLVYERQNKILEILKSDGSVAVSRLASMLYISEPTVRRDLISLEKRGLIKKVYGGAVVNDGPADKEIPFSIREQEQNSIKNIIAKKAIELIHDGDVIMLDGSTSAFNIVRHLGSFKDIIVITSGAKTAVALAEMNIRTFCTGGNMIIHSFSYVGEQAERFAAEMNADIVFFSCRGLSLDGKLTDINIEEANLRKVMLSHSKRKVLLCDSSKIGKTYFYNFCTVKDIDDIICDRDLPPQLNKK